jgi:hypothetical protein
VALPIQHKLLRFNGAQIETFAINSLRTDIGRT